MAKAWVALSSAGNSRQPNLVSPPANPLPILIERDVYRTLFSGRDADNRSPVGAVGTDIVQREFIREESHPFDLAILAHG